MTSVSSVTEEVTSSTGSLYGAINTISTIADNVLENTVGVSNNAKVQEEMMDEMRQNVNNLSVLSKELKDDLNVFKTEGNTNQ